MIDLLLLLLVSFFLVLSMTKWNLNLFSKKASKANGPASGGGMARPPVPGMTQAPPSIPHTASAPAPVSSGPQLGGLFVNGMPTLRKTRGAAVDTGRNMSCKKFCSILIFY